MIMMMTASPPPPIPYPTKSKSKSSFSSYSPYSSPAKYRPSTLDKLNTAGDEYKKKKRPHFSKLGGSLYDDTSLFGSQGGMGADMYKDSGSDVDIDSSFGSMNYASPPSIGSVDLADGYKTTMEGDMGTDSDTAHASPSLSLCESGSETFGSKDTAKKDDTSPSWIFGKSRPPMFRPTGIPSTKSSIWAPYSKLPPPPPLADTPPPAVYSNSSLSKPVSGSAAPSRPLLFGSMGSMLAMKKGRTKPKFDSPDSIAIAYTPSSSLPAERLSSETAVQPLSLRTKALIDLQTYEGCFKLDSALAPLIGVSITDLEAKLAMCSVFGGSGNAGGLSEEQKRNIWATVFVIKVFETQLAAERSVWGLVVDKAGAWMKAIVGDEDAKELERLAGEVLGV